jgi:hypothetical protein
VRVARATSERSRLLLPVRASLIGISAGFLASFVGSLWMRFGIPDGELLSYVVSPLRLAGWLVTLAHGVPIVVRTAAGVASPDVPGSLESVSKILGGGSDIVFTFSVVFIPLVLLAVAGIAVALAIRFAKPSSTREVLAWCGVTALTHGTVLAVIAWRSSMTRIVEATLAPDLGLGAASGHAGLSIGASPMAAFAIGAAWGAAFAAAGGLSALRIRGSIDPSSRIVLLGWMRGLGTASACIAGALALGALVALILGRAPAPSLVGLGAYLLSANAVAAGILASSGASLAVALDAGPFNGWERADLLNVGATGETAPIYLWVLVLVPLVSAYIAGRFIARRSALSPRDVALRYGALWGLTLALLALLLRVRVLSSFSVGSLDLGGGSAAFDPLVAMLLGAVWGGVGSFLGARTGEVAHWTCPSCGITNADDDRFCVSCGAVRA